MWEITCVSDTVTSVSCKLYLYYGSGYNMIWFDSLNIIGLEEICEYLYEMIIIIIIIIVVYEFLLDFIVLLVIYLRILTIIPDKD